MRSQLIFQKLPEGHSNSKRYFLKLQIERYFSPVDIDFAKLIYVVYLTSENFIVIISWSYCHCLTHFFLTVACLLKLPIWNYGVHLWTRKFVNVRRRPKTIKYVLLLKTWSSVNLVVLNCLRRLKNNVFNFVVLPDKYTWKSTWIFYFIIINHRWQNKYYRCQLLLWNVKYLHTSCLREKLKARAIKINIWMTYKAWLVIQN